MLDYSKVQSITIPEGSVAMIARGSEILWQSNRKYKRVLAYLMSTGTQYINTGIIPSRQHATRCDLIGEFSNAASATGFGARNGEANTYLFISTSANQFRIDYGRSVALRFVSWTPSKKTQANRVVINGVNKTATIYYSDGTSESHSYSTSNTCTITQPILMFAYNNAGTPVKATNMKISACKMYNGNTLVRDFIPVLDWDDVACMYDKVSDRFFYNAGTGEFLTGC